jgi:cell division protein FtsI (penicillin-binding protein 3)
MVNQPAYNPNRRGADFSDMRNRAVTDTYEPGSTVKPLTLVAALESGQFKVDSVIDTTPGYVRVGTKVIEDPLNRGELSLTNILKKSSQVGIAKVAMQLPDDSVFNLFARAGFGTYTGLGLPGESTGRLPPERIRDPLSRVTLAYGYGFAATPLQLAQSYMALANSGNTYPVSILRRAAAPPARRVFAETAAMPVREMLAAVVAADGTAPQAQVLGYLVGGKTGTVRKVGKDGYDNSRHVALFAGIAPLHDPEIVMVVVINEPSRGLAGGGAVAAPVFSRVAARALRTLGVEPQINTETLLAATD